MNNPLTEAAFRGALGRRINALDITQAKEDVVRFLPSPDSVAVWSKDFFHDVAAAINVEK